MAYNDITFFKIYVYILQYCTLGNKKEVFWGRPLFKGNELLDSQE